MHNGTDYYQVLGVEPGATDQEIKAAYRRGALAFHPDRNGDNPEAAEKMKGLNEAYGVLSDPGKRAEYDSLKHRFGDSAYSHFRQSHSYQDIFNDSDIESIFDELARSFGLRGFDDLFRQDGGIGFRTTRYGDSGVHGRTYVFTGIFGSGAGSASHHPYLASRGATKLASRIFKNMTGIDLPVAGRSMRDTIYVSKRLASEGGSVDYQTRKGNKKLAIKIPPGVREGQQIRLAGMGEQGTGGGPPGDIYLTIRTKKSLYEKVAAFFSWFFK